MKRFFALLLILGSFVTESPAQTLALRKGVIMDSLPLQDSVSSRLKLYLPQDFEGTRNWPLLFICHLDTDVQQTMRYLKSAADSNGYILASSSVLPDSVSLTKRLLSINNSVEKLKDLLPVDNARIYAAGYDQGGQLAVLVPSLIPSVSGVLSIASILPNPELISSKKRFDYVNIMGRADYQYIQVSGEEELLDQRKIPNFTLYHPEGHEWPELGALDLGMQVLTLLSMKKKEMPRDSALLRASYEDFRDRILKLESEDELLLAMDFTQRAEDLFDNLYDTDWFRWKRKELRSSRAYKDQKRDLDRVLLNERILTDDYIFYLDQDVLNFNLNNLGWWNFQMEKISKYKESPRKEEQLLGLRLEGFVNALIDDYVEVSAMGPNPDDDALIFLFMLNTISGPEEAVYFLQVISLTAKYSDFGTANFYLEELLKKGYKDADRLYNLPHTGLLRISPEFNAILLEYLGEARYPTEE